MKKNISLTMTALIGGLVLTQAFQNCAQPFELASTGIEDGSFSMGSEHPGATIAEASSQSPVLAHRKYIASLMTDVFTTDSMAGADKTFVNTTLNSWIVTQPSVYGYPCNMKNDAGECNGTILSPMHSGTNTLRAAYKSQACQTILSKNVYVNAVVSKVSTLGAAPTATSIEALYELFYRGDDADPVLIQGLLSSDRAILNQNMQASPTDRWRYLILALCESPGWEQL
ncbi:MAG: hypothetical protein ACKOX6_14865 [Bdellovibrio sp.]